MSKYIFNRIWLQDLGGETSWCSDQIHDEDLEYVRADRVTELEDLLQEVHDGDMARDHDEDLHDRIAKKLKEKS